MAHHAARTTCILRIVVASLTLIALLATVGAHASAENIKFKIITKAPNMLICEQGVVTVKVRVTPAQRGRVVYLSRWNTGRWIDDSKGKTNSAGLVELPVRTTCARGWNGARKVEFSFFTVDRDTNKWAYSKSFKSTLYRLAGFKTSGFESCTALAVGDPCIVGAHPASGAFDINRDRYFIEVWSTDPKTGSLVEKLPLFDLNSEGRVLEIIEDPFAFGITSPASPFATSVVMILSDSNGDPVAWSDHFPVAWG